eukprot:c7619_g1_i3.p1 GENE.c7619_g1_i3~~c7619_g1_i3.p1  ORF type:complete len:679 (+),score=148.55 c7619_g1_i3:145-2037(+)
MNAKALFDTGPVRLPAAKGTPLPPSPKTPGRPRCFSEPVRADIDIDPLCLLGSPDPDEIAQRLAQFSPKRQGLDSPIRMGAFGNGMFMRSLNENPSNVIGPARQRATSLFFPDSHTGFGDDDANGLLGGLQNMQISTSGAQSHHDVPTFSASIRLPPAATETSHSPRAPITSTHKEEDRVRSASFTPLGLSSWPPLSQSQTMPAPSSNPNDRARGSSGSSSSDHNIHNAHESLRNTSSSPHSDFGDDDGPMRECSNLFVNYLPQSIDDRGLHQLFAQFGEIHSCKVMLDLNTNRSRCFGFVKYLHLEDAKLALKKMNGKRLEHKTLIVKFANTEDTTSMGTPSSNLYIKGLPPHFGDVQLKTLFEKYGEIQDSRVLVDLTTGASRGIAFVRFSDVNEARVAITELNNTQVHGSEKPILVKFADTDDERVQRKQRQVRRRKLQHLHMQQMQPNPAMPMVVPYRAAWDEPFHYRQMMASPHHKPMPYAYPSPLSAPMSPGAMFMPPGPIDAVTMLGGMDGMGISVPSPSTPRHVEPMSPIPAMPLYGPLPPPLLEATTELCVTNLPQNANEQMLLSLFVRYGAVSLVKVITDEHRQPTGIVRMQYPDAVNAMNHLNGQQVSGKMLQVAFRHI